MPQNAASDQGLHCLLKESSIRISIKMKNTTNQHLKLKWTGPIDNNGKFHSAKYVKQTPEDCIWPNKHTMHISFANCYILFWKQCRSRSAGFLWISSTLTQVWCIPFLFIQWWMQCNWMGYAWVNEDVWTCTQWMGINNDTAPLEHHWIVESVNPAPLE